MFYGIRPRAMLVAVGIFAMSIPLYSMEAQPVSSSMTSDTISIRNGLIAIDISRGDGVLSTIKEFDKHAYRDLGVTTQKATYVAPSDNERDDPSTAMYWDANGGADVIPTGMEPETKGYYRFRSGQVKVDLAVNNSDRAEVVMVAASTPLFPFSVETHYIVFRGQSGFYAYVVLRHEKTALAATLGQTRFVVKTVMDGTFDQWAVGNGKFVPIPQSPIVKKLTDVTWLLADGTIKSKYMNSVYWDQVPVYGYVGKNLGLWMIEPSPEYHNGGPVKQGQILHDNVLLRVLQSGHFGSSPVHAGDGEEWSKVYGPFFVYANHGANVNELWSDAVRQLAHEKMQWPYKWVTSPEYDHKRGTVIGRVQIANCHLVHAKAILSDSGVDWSAQSKGYNYWATINPNGSFRIDHVVSGKYSLFISGADQPKDFVKQFVEVKGNQVNNLGKIDWTPITHGAKIFQIGVFDRSAGEFRNGDNARKYAMFKLYPEQFPHDVNFYIGKSDEKKDWNYAQWTSYSENPAWKIHFRTHAMHGEATLTIGFASAQPAHKKMTDLRIRVNNVEVDQIHLPKTGTAGYRGGVQDSPYNLREIRFSADLLKDGENVIELQHADAQPFSQYKSLDDHRDIPENGSPGQVMYDAIRLEVQQEKQTLLYQDDFQNGLQNWFIESEKPGLITAKAGALSVDVPAGATIWLKKKLHKPVLIEYQAKVIEQNGSNDRVSDLNCFWMATDPANPQDLFANPRHGTFSEYNTLHLYYVGLGGNNNTTTRFRRYIGDSEKRPLLPENDLSDRDSLLTPNREQTIRLIANGNEIAYERDGKRLFTYMDDRPYKEGWFGFRTTHSHIEFRNLRIFQLQNVGSSTEKDKRFTH